MELLWNTFNDATAFCLDTYYCTAIDLFNSHTLFDFSIQKLLKKPIMHGYLTTPKARVFCKLGSQTRSPDLQDPL